MSRKPKPIAELGDDPDQTIVGTHRIVRDCFTPGPWTLQPIGDESECNVLGKGRELIATVADYDARLIAAAPDLLDALRLVYANAAESPEWIRSKIGPAIAKAEGRSV